MLIGLENVTKDYGRGVVLESVTGRIEPGQRIGLVGANGAGKSTLLGLLEGSLQGDSGEIYRSPGLEIGVLRQDGGLAGSGGIYEEMRHGFSALYQLEAEIADLQQQMSNIHQQDSQAFHQLSQSLSQKQAYFEQREGYLIDVKIKTVLQGMGFPPDTWERPVTQLSGGEKTRLAICKLLLTEPALLMLDEPTNHLDFQTLEWLEGYLQSYKGAMVLVSHDRYFLDVLCQHIWEIEHTHLHTYKGGYTAYLPQKEARVQQLQKAYQGQQAEREKLEDYVRRNITRASTSAMAKSRRLQLEKMEPLSCPKLPPKPPRLVFESGSAPVSEVLQVQGLTVTVGEGEEMRQLLSQVDFTVKRGEKIAFVGPNGIGKTSFFRVLTEPARRRGGVLWGRGTRIGVFLQDDSQLTGRESALDWLWKRFPRLGQQPLRDMLGQLRISGEDVFKSVCALSGGQRARLKFACLMLETPNVLLLDEPTNHLDLPTREVLEEALAAYDGTVLVISHDRYLLSRIPDKIVAFTDGGLTEIPGRYEAYQKRQRTFSGLAPVQSGRQETVETASSQKNNSEKPAGENPGYRSKAQRRQDAQRKAALRKAQEDAACWEQEVERLEAEIASPEVAADYPRLTKCCAALEEARRSLDEAMELWLTLEEE